MGRIINEDVFLEILKMTGSDAPETKKIFFSFDTVKAVLRMTPTAPTFVFPCKVGDEVWCFRDTRVYNKPVKGTVTEIYFLDNMDMCIVVRRLCRGRWGDRVFATEQEAQAAIDRRLNDGKM